MDARTQILKIFFLKVSFSFNEMNLSSPIMIWSRSSMYSNLQANAKRSVVSTSFELGVGSPDGWVAYLQMSWVLLFS